MFEARLTSSAVLKKVLDAIKDLLNEATFDCSDSGIQVLIDFFSDWLKFFCDWVLKWHYNLFACPV